MTTVPHQTGELEVYRFPETDQQIRTVLRAGDPWFIAADALTVLDLNRSSTALLDDDEKGVHSVDTPGGQQKVAVVSEAGLYSLILRSRKPEAKAFKRWITHEVLPAIRKTGSYTAIPRSFAEALELAAKQAREIEAQTAELAAITPAAEAWDVLASAEGDWSVREAAHILNRDPAIEIGQNRLFVLLRGLGLIDRNDRPYQSHANHVRLRPVTYLDGADVERTAQQVRITAAGLKYLHQRLGGTRQLRLLVSRESAA